MIDLYTAATPNGWKASICLEELGLPYEVTHLHFDKLEHKEERYLEINPNGRIPAIIDRENQNFTVFESGAILIYLAEKAGKLLPTNSDQRSVALQWLMFQMSGIGPMHAYSRPSLPLIPDEACHPFHAKPATDSTAKLPPWQPA